MRILICSAAAFYAAALPVSTQAQVAQQPTAPAPQVSLQPASPTPKASDASTHLIDEAELAGLNGRQGSSQVSVLSEQDLVAVNNGNTIVAGSVGSGQISIDRGAFEGFTGIGNFVINSGHNNNLQGAITINIVQP